MKNPRRTSLTSFHNMKLRAILAILFIALLSLSTLVEARSSSTSSRSSSSSSRSSSSSSSYSTSKPSTPTATPSTSSYSKSYSTSSTPKATTTSTPKATTTSTPKATTTSTPKASPSIGYPYKQPNPSYVPPKNTATHTTTINNRTVIYSNGVGGNGSTFFDSMLGTMAGMAVYDMITDDKGQTIKVEPYYVSGETRIPVGSWKVVPKEIEVPPEPDLPFDWTVFWYVVGWLSGIAFIWYLFVKP